MRRPLPGEEGYILVAVMFLLAILVMSMAVAVPRIKAEIQRDREVETMQRGKQYARAIKMYYKKFNAYPPNIDALGKTNNIRFLRKRYLDPMTGKDDWKPIMFGQNKWNAAGHGLLWTAAGGRSHGAGGNRAAGRQWDCGGNDSGRRVKRLIEWKRVFKRQHVFEWRIGVRFGPEFPERRRRNQWDVGD